MNSCKDCIHFGICKKGFPWADGKGGGWCEDFKSKVDHVEVVLCKNCCHYHPYSKPVEDFDGECCVRGCETDEEEYCSYGRRKDGDSK